MQSVTVIPTAVEGEIIQASGKEPWWTRVYTSLIDNLRSEHSRKAYRDSLTMFFSAAGKLPAEITKQDVIDFRECLRSEGQANASVNRHLAAIRAFYRDALLDGYVAVNPSATVRSLETSADGTTKMLSPAQYRAILSSMDDRTLQGARNKALFLVLIWTGIRLAECARLTIADLSEQQGFWTFRIIRKGGKTQYVVIEEQAYHALTHWLGLAEIEHGPIWINLRHHSRAGIKVDAIRRIIEQLAVDAGMTMHVHPHMLRTSFINYSLDGGAPLHKVQYAAGHADPRTTLRYKRAKDNLVDSATSYIKL